MPSACIKSYESLQVNQITKTDSNCPSKTLHKVDQNNSENNQQKLIPEWNVNSTTTLNIVGVKVLLLLLIGSKSIVERLSHTTPQEYLMPYSLF